MGETVTGETEQVVQPYAPRRAAPDDNPPLYWAQMEVQDFDPFQTAEERARAEAYVGSHRASEVEEVETVSEEAAEEPVSVAEEEEAIAEEPVAEEAPAEEPAVVSGAVRADAATETTRSGEDIVPGLEEHPPEPVSFASRLTDKWRRAGKALGLYFRNPEKGRRRQIATVLGGYALLGLAAWVFGHASNEDHSKPQAKPTSPATTPSEKPTQSFIDSLKPEDYDNQPYEWGAVADQASPADATPTILDMVEDARKQGAKVEMWGDVHSGHWGITSITVEFSDGTQKTYHDTPHKLAILQYFSDQNDLDKNNGDTSN
ncbi:MAG TPA: hypothetical protein VIS56_01205 [Candidatus Saccharimonadales bacterium]